MIHVHGFPTVAFQSATRALKRATDPDSKHCLRRQMGLIREIRVILRSFTHELNPSLHNPNNCLGHYWTE